MKKETFTTKAGQSLTIRYIGKNDSPKAFRDYINELIEEKVYLSLNKKVTLKQEKEWLKKRLKGKRQKECINIIATDKNKVVANVSAERGQYRESDNVTLGIAILRAYRGKGLGTFLLKLIIRDVKKSIKPKNIFLTVHSANKPAIRLYRRLGFKTIGRLPDWILHQGRYFDSIQMLYTGR